MLQIEIADIVHHLNHHLIEIAAEQDLLLVDDEEKFKLVRDEDILLAGVYGSHVYGLANDESDIDIFIIVSEILDEKFIKLRELKNTQDYSYQVTELEIRGKQVDFSIYSEKLFRELLGRFILDSFEFYTIALKRREWMIHVNEPFFNENIQKFMEGSVVNSPERALNLRKAISKESDHSFVKGKNKIVKEFKVYKGIKAIFHAMRTVVFGIQIANHNQVVDFSQANQYWKEIETFYKEKLETLLSPPSLSATDEQLQTQSTVVVVDYEKIWLSLREEFQPKLRQLQTEFRKSIKTISSSEDVTC